MDAMVAKKAKANKGRSEELRYDSVVAVNPGLYDVELMSSDGAVKAKSQLVALSEESYVIMRTGVEAQQGPSYPQELLIYPKSDVAALKGAAAKPFTLVAAVLAMVLSFSRSSDWRICDPL